MSHEHNYTGWRELVVKRDEKLPFVLIGVILSMINYTLCEYFHFHWHHWFHTDLPHTVANHHGMWVFFSYLGLELTVREIQKAGRFAGCATIGGMVFPPLFTALLMYMLTGEVNWYIALGAAATDVAFSVGAARMFTKGNSAILALLMNALLILAVGDDLGGIVAMALVYATGIVMIWVIIESGVLMFTYWWGEKGEVFLIAENVDTGDKSQWKLLAINRSVVFWVWLALVNTFILVEANLEWILGGCFAYIMAPAEVKEKLIHFLKPYIPFVLFIFGVVNGAIDLLNPNSWGVWTAATFFGGMYGKRIGIFAGGLLGRAWDRKAGGKYGDMPTNQIYGLALFASANGTVAIFFVVKALLNHYASQEIADQATLGYFLTVLAVYGESWICQKMEWIKDDPMFRDADIMTETA